MKINYVSSAMDVEDFSMLFKDSSNTPGQQAQKYNRLMIEGLAANGITVKAITGRPITSKNCRDKFINAKDTIKNNLCYHYCSTINIPIIKIIWQFLTTFFNVLKDKSSEETIIIVDVLNASIAYGAVLAAKLRNKECIGIVTDLPELMVTGNKKSQVNLINKVIKKCTAYVLLTEAMNQIINPNNKPYTIIEGLCDINMFLKEKKKVENNVKICMYAGLLDARYGVKNMVEGFAQANIKNSELHIYGNGPYVSELKKITKDNKNIIYKGSVMNNEVVKAELKASLLLNPRPTTEEFTKYSFPSKNMEYMVSGTPLLTTNLPGMPKEYKSYVYLFKEETTKEMGLQIKEILEKNESELFHKGRQAKQFVLKEKNNVIQAGKIITLCKKGS